METFFIVIYIWFSFWVLLESIIFATDSEYDQTFISCSIRGLRLELKFIILCMIIPFSIMTTCLWLKDELD